LIMFFTDKINLGFVCFSPYKLLLEKINYKSCEAFKNIILTWNEVERVERQQNGQTSRYFDVAIPTELNNDDKKKLVLEYCQK
ncbi:MobA/MobL family protein, partial [Klebsiella pneumoniae]|uniref:MobA/MobL family protein n=1 Tax=Klebsiella pneumoniae TaxID=573 RepID=UPI0027DEDBA8